MLWKFKLENQNSIEFLSKMLLPRDVLKLIENSSKGSSNYRSSIVYIYVRAAASPSYFLNIKNNIFLNKFEKEVLLLMGLLK